MLAKTNPIAKAQISLIEEAVLEIEIIRERQMRNVPRAKQLDVIAVDAHVVRRDLLVVADDDNFLRDVMQEQRFRT